ncbi:DEAD/DEAH box helicase [Aureivirga sp. CE67]|uniref:DEAD/DEAH box helicase n=1 Tax=Aureivirga sp. CE67 TaxID=1788983 RepID=UPI0018CB7D3A|nr:DEAD/DEAH box helicase [Aureivirga sp. CE67]
MQFKDLKLNKPILRAITEKNYTTPTEVQHKVIPQIIEQNDVIVTAQTGTGKTASFALPILRMLFDRQDAPKKGKKIRALVVNPTRELAIQVQENFKQYGKYTNLVSTAIFGGVSAVPQQEILERGVDILIATPGRLLDLHKQDVFRLDKVEQLVLDEADLMLDMGFINDIRKIERLCPKDRQTLLFSATMPDAIEELAKTIMFQPTRVTIAKTSSTADTIVQKLMYVPKSEKVALCVHLLERECKGSTIIFRRTKFGADKLEKSLTKKGFNVTCLHGNKSQNARQKALNRFKNGDARILIATDVAARGIDISAVDAVINFDLPNIAETYVHRIGRTGRAGINGESYSFCCEDEKEYVATIETLIGKKIPVDNEHPFPLDPDLKPQVHTKKSNSKHRKNRKSEASRKKKKRWY